MFPGRKIVRQHKKCSFATSSALPIEIPGVSSFHRAASCRDCRVESSSCSRVRIARIVSSHRHRPRKQASVSVQATAMPSYFFHRIRIASVFVHVGNDAFSIVLKLLFVDVVHMFVQQNFFHFAIFQSTFSIFSFLLEIERERE